MFNFGFHSKAKSSAPSRKKNRCVVKLILRHITEGYISPMTIASIHARLGNKDEAFTWLDKAVDERASGIPNLKVDPRFDSLHSDPRFAKLLQRMNLTP